MAGQFFSRAMSALQGLLTRRVHKTLRAYRRRFGQLAVEQLEDRRLLSGTYLHEVLVEFPTGLRPGVVRISDRGDVVYEATQSIDDGDDIRRLYFVDGNGVRDITGSFSEPRLQGIANDAAILATVETDRTDQLDSLVIWQVESPESTRFIDGDDGDPSAFVSDAVGTISQPVPEVEFKVTYRDNLMLDLSTLDAPHMMVRGPGDQMISAHLTSTFTVPSDLYGHEVVATYRLPGPGGQWDSADNGLWTIAILPERIADATVEIMGNFVPNQFRRNWVPEEDLSSFIVNIDPSRGVAEEIERTSDGRHSSDSHTPPLSTKAFRHNVLGSTGPGDVETVPVDFGTSGYFAELNNSGEIAFVGSARSDPFSFIDLLIKRLPNGEYYGAEVPIHSQVVGMSDDGRVLLHSGLSDEFRLYDSRLESFVTVISPSYVADPPHISNDGKVIAFRGIVPPDSPMEWGEPGTTGYFASIQSNGAERQVFKIAGQDDDRVIQLWERWLDSNENLAIDSGEEHWAIRLESTVQGLNSRLTDDGTGEFTFLVGGRRRIWDSPGDPSVDFQLADFTIDVVIERESKGGTLQLEIGWPNRVDDDDSFASFVSGVPAMNQEGEVLLQPIAHLPDAIIKATEVRRPVLVVPGLFGSFVSNIEQIKPWLMTRGVEPDWLRIDPIGRVYDDLIMTLETAGYTHEKDLFVVPYDWRLPNAPTDTILDGVISNISADSITSRGIEYGVDYLGRALHNAATRWSQDHPGEILDRVDVIAHSMGGLVTRSYIQSPAYGGTTTDGTMLPKVDSYITIGTPHRGAAQAWNPAHNNLIVSKFYRDFVRPLVHYPYRKVVEKNMRVQGAGGGISRMDILDDGQPSQKRFIEKYVPSVLDVLPAYEFLQTSSESEYQYADEEHRNNLILDLNAGLDTSTPVNDFDDCPAPTMEDDFHSFANDVQFTVVYGVGDMTVAAARERLGPSDKEVILPIYPAGGLRRANREELYYTDLNGMGDGTVPVVSSVCQFELDRRVIPRAARNTDAGNPSDIVTDGSTEHSGLVSNRDVQQSILATLGRPVGHEDISTGTGIDHRYARGAIAVFIFDPVEGFVIDGEGNRLGWTAETGSVAEIPNSVYFGEADGIGWIFESLQGPVELRLTGLGEDHYVFFDIDSGGRQRSYLSEGFLEIGQEVVIPIDVDGDVPCLGVGANDCPPDLDLSAVSAKTIQFGQQLAFNIFNEGATVVDRNSAGDATDDTIRLQLDPDVPEDTPEGATITPEGIFTWLPTRDQVGEHQIVVIAVDQGSPPLADAETFTIVVTAEENEPPSVDLNGDDPGTGFIATFVEDGGPAAIVDSDLTVTDPDDANLASAIARLVNRPDGNAETLSVNTNGTSIIAEFNTSDGVLSMTGTASLADYEQVVRSLQYNNTSQNPDTTDRTVKVTVNDGVQDSATAIATISMQAVNDPPSIDLNGGDPGTGYDAIFTEDEGPVLIVGDVTITDPDSTALVSASVQITNPFDGTAESLNVDTSGTVIAAMYISAIGQLTLSGTDSISNYENVLRSLEYNNTSQNPDTTARTIEVTANDGLDQSNVATSTVTVVAENDAPDLQPILNQQASLGQLLEVTVMATDPENDTLNYQLDRDNEPGIPDSAIITKRDNNTAVITWTPSNDDGPGPFPFLVLVTEENTTPPLSDSEEFTVTLVTSGLPVVDLNGDDPGRDFEATFTEGGGPIAVVDTDLTVADPDDVNLQSATATITNLQDGAAESLAVDDNLAQDITAAYVAATGVLTLSGDDTLANYQAVLRTLQYNNTSRNPTTTDRTVTVVINDATNVSNPATATVSVVPENDLPNLLLPDPFDDESTPIEVQVGQAINFTARVADPDNPDSEIFFILDLDNSGIPDTAAQPSITSPPSNVPGGAFSWTPDTTGVFVVTVVVTDVHGLADQESFTVNVVDFPPGIAELSPADGETMVNVTRETVVRFSKPVDAATINNDTFYLIANGVRVPGRIRVAPNREFVNFATFFYGEPSASTVLPASTAVRVMVEGDRIIGANGKAVDGDGDGIAGGTMTAEFRTLPLTRIPGTTVFGYVYDSDRKNDDGTDVPLVGATIRVDAFPEANAITDQNGYFELGVDPQNQDNKPGLPAPEFFVHIDGSTATHWRIDGELEPIPDGTTFPNVGKPLHSVPGRSVRIAKNGQPFDIYLPPMTAGDATSLGADTDTPVGFGPGAMQRLAEMFPEIDPAVWEHMQVIFPAGGAVDSNGNVATAASVIPVPPKRLPAPLPEGIDPMLVVSIQAGESGDLSGEFTATATNFDVPAPVTFPNLEGLDAGDKTVIVSFNHDAGEWEPIGTGTVSDDGLNIVSDPGVGIRAPGWHWLEQLIEITGTAWRFTKCFGTGVGDTARLYIATSAQGAAIGADLISEFSGKLGIPKLPLKDVLLNTLLSNSLDILADTLDQGETLSKEQSLDLAKDIFLDIVGEIDPDFDVHQRAILAGMKAHGFKQEIDKFFDRMGRAVAAEEAFHIALRECVFGSQDTDGSVGERAAPYVSPLQEILDNFDELVGRPPHTRTVTEDLDILGPGYPPIDDDLPSHSGLRYLRELARALEHGAVFWELLGENPDGINDAESLAEMADALEGLLEVRPFFLNDASIDDSQIHRRNLSELIDDLELLLRTMEIDLEPLAQRAERLHYAFVDSTSDVDVIRGITDVNGSVTTLLRADTEYQFNAYDPESNLTWSQRVITPASGSVELRLLPAFEHSEDEDDDLLGASAEMAIGTRKDLFDTDGDGISDFDEVQLGLDPLGRFGFPNGIVASLPIRNETGQVVSANEVAIEAVDADSGTALAYVATSHGLAIVDVTDFDLPIALGQVGLGGDSLDVSVDSNLQVVAVAAGENGLHLVDVTEAMMPVPIQTIDVRAFQVEVAGGMAYVGTDDGKVIAYMLEDGSRYDELYISPSAITGMAQEGDILYTMGSDRRLQTIEFGGTKMRRRGAIVMPHGGGKLFVGDGVAYAGIDRVMSQGFFRGGFATADVSNSDELRLLSGSDVGRCPPPNDDRFCVAPGMAIISNGSGEGLLIGTPDQTTDHMLAIVDLADPSNTNVPETEIVVRRVLLPEAPKSVALYDGIAFVADGAAGLQVVNYQPFDTGDEPPDVTIDEAGLAAMDVDPARDGVQVVEGTAIPVSVVAMDSESQVRSVELLIDRTIVRADTAFPFVFSLVASDIPDGESSLIIALSARAQDGGFNLAESDPVELEIVPDTIGPTVVSVSPGDGELLAPDLFEQISVQFSEPVTDGLQSAFGLLGPDGASIDMTDVPRLTRGGTAVTVSYSALAALGDYEFVIHQDQIADLAGNTLGAGEQRVNFTVVDGAAFVYWINQEGGSWTDGANWSTGELPGADDDVLISVPGQVEVHLFSPPFDQTIASFVNEESLFIHQARLNVASPSTNNGLLAAVGVRPDGIVTNAELAVGGRMIWGGGQLVGDFVILPSGLLEIAGDERHFLRGELSNRGRTEWLSGDINNDGFTARIHNQVGASISILGDASLARNTGSGNHPELENDGDVQKFSGLGTSQLRAVVHNRGIVSVDSGAMLLNGGGESSGEFHVKENATLAVSHSHTFDENSVIDGDGNVQFINTNVTVEVRGVYTVGGITIVDTGGEVRFPSAITIPNLLLDARGTLVADQSVTIDNNMEWFGGGVVSGTLNVARGSELTLSGQGNRQFPNGILNNEGTVTWLAGNIVNGGTIHNLSEGVFEIVADANVRLGQGTTGVINDGLFRNGSNGIVTLEAPITNRGTFEHRVGRLEVLDYLQSEGVTLVGAAATLFDVPDLSTGRELRINAGEMAGHGTIDSDVTTSATVLPGGDADFGTLTIMGNYIQETQGTLSIDVGGINAGEFDQLAVSGMATFAGTFDLALVDDFEPQIGDAFTVVTYGSRDEQSEFDPPQVPATLPEDRTIELEYLDNELVLQIVAAGNPLVGAGPQPPVEPRGAAVTTAEIEPLLSEAIAWWISAGTDQLAIDRLRNLRIEVADLSGVLLAQSVGLQIIVDRDAAGYGWFMDPTPENHAEFTIRQVDGTLEAREASAAAGQMDLLTVLAHELGHVLGFDDRSAGPRARGVMEGILAPGFRRLPSVNDIDTALAGEEDWVVAHNR